MPDKFPLSEIVQRRGDTVYVDLWYPDVSEDCRTIQIGLMAVRAADDIRIQYDFTRNGFVILQEVHWKDTHGQTYCQDPERWIEVAFVKAWQHTEPLPPQGA